MQDFFHQQYYLSTTECGWPYVSEDWRSLRLHARSKHHKKNRWIQPFSKKGNIHPKNKLLNNPKPKKTCRKKRECFETNIDPWERRHIYISDSEWNQSLVDIEKTQQVSSWHSIFLVLHRGRVEMGNMFFFRRIPHLRQVFQLQNVQERTVSTNG